MASLADQLINLMMVLLYVVLGIFTIYLTLRVGSLAILKSIDDIKQQRKQQLAKSHSANN
jgi:hypothetical protein